MDCQPNSCAGVGAPNRSANQRDTMGWNWLSKSHLLRDIIF
jgi:hypothetical protein